MNGPRLREQRLQAGIGYRRLAKAMGVGTSRIVAIERCPEVSDEVSIRFIEGLVLVQVAAAISEPSPLAGVAG